MKSDNKIGILYVDDESVALKYFEEIFENMAPVFTAVNGEEGVRVFKEHEHEIGVVLSDKNMPKMNGLDFLAEVRRINDRPIRILVTAYKDLNQAVDALNDGLLHAYLTKPWETKDMMSKMRKSLDLFWIKQEKGRLLRDRASFYQELMAAEKVNSIETLSIGLDHHISKALQVVKSYFDMIPAQLDQELDGAMPKDRFFWDEYYSNVGQQMDRIESILNGLSECLLSDASGQASTLNVSSGIDIGDLIAEVGKAETANQNGVDFVIRGEQGVIDGDQVKLLRLFSTLFRESIQNIGPDKNGQIDIVIEEETLSDGSKGLSIFLSDDGIPIEPETRKRLFDPFFIRSNRPTDPGLGLLSCFVITYQHGGMIAADTNSKKNTIHLLLPQSPRSPRELEKIMRGLI